MGETKPRDANSRSKGCVTLLSAGPESQPYLRFAGRTPGFDKSGGMWSNPASLLGAPSAIGCAWDGASQCGVLRWGPRTLNAQ
jgi:hypothetical protein